MFTLKTCRVEKRRGISKKYDIHKALCGCFLNKKVPLTLIRDIRYKSIYYENPW
jgi:hypothetical protein